MLELKSNALPGAGLQAGDDPLLRFSFGVFVMKKVKAPSSTGRDALLTFGSGVLKVLKGSFIF